MHPSVNVCASIQGWFHNLSAQTFHKFYRGRWQHETGRDDFSKQMRRDKKCLFNGTTNYGRDWKKGAGKRCFQCRIKYWLGQTWLAVGFPIRAERKVKSRAGSPDWNVLMVDMHFQNLLWVYCPGHARVKENHWADRKAGKATLTSGLFLRRSETLRSLRHYLWAQSQGHYTIDYLEERGV